MSPVALVWLAIGWIGVALVPWHIFDSASWFDWINAYPASGPRSALGLGITGAEWWLLPITLPLLLASVPLVFARSRDQISRILVAAGIAGLFALLLQGFAIGIAG